MEVKQHHSARTNFSNMEIFVLLKSLTLQLLYVGYNLNIIKWQDT